VAEPLLEEDVGFDLVEGDVARPLDHHLDAGRLGPLGQLAQDDKLVDLGPVGGVGQASRPETVPQGQGHVVFFRDLQESVEVLEEGVFAVVVGHPLHGEGPAAGDHIHEPPFVLHPFDGGAGYAAMDGDEVDAVLGVFDDPLEDVVHGHVDDGLLLGADRVQGRLVEGD